MTKLFILLSIAFIAFSSCEQIPDLNPNTNAGATISVFEIGDTVINDTIYSSVNYDLVGDFQSDVGFYFDGINAANDSKPGFVIDVNGETLVKPNSNNLQLDRVQTFNNNGVNFTAGSYSARNVNLFDGVCFQVFDLCLFERITKSFLPNGTKYLMIKVSINDALHYGWVEYFSDLQIDDQEIDGILVIKRIGIADEAGVVLRAGQTN